MNKSPRIKLTLMREHILLCIFKRSTAPGYFWGRKSTVPFWH